MQSAVRIDSGTISIISEHKDARFGAPPSNQGLHDPECRLKSFWKCNLSLALCSVYAKGWRMSTCCFVWVSADLPHSVQIHLIRLVRACLVASVSSLGPLGPQPARRLCPWVFPGKNTGDSCHALLQRIFPTQGSNPCLWHVYCIAGGFFTAEPPGTPLIRHALWWCIQAFSISLRLFS